MQISYNQMTNQLPTEKQVRCMYFIIHTLDLYGGDEKFEKMWFEDCTKRMAQEFIGEYLPEAQRVVGGTDVYSQ